MVWCNTTHFQLKPTFPIDGVEIQRRVMKALVTHPLNWGVGLACIAIPLLAQAGAFLTLLAIGGGAAGLLQYWKAHLKDIEANVIREMIDESNREQNRALTEAMTAFRREGFAHYASALGRFLLLKQRIETLLHRDGKLTPDREAIDRLGDQVCAAACRQFDRIKELDREIAFCVTSQDKSRMTSLINDRAELLSKIQQAYSVLYDTLEALQGLETEVLRVSGTPSRKQERSDSISLDDAADALRTQTLKTLRIHERLLDVAASAEKNISLDTTRHAERQ